MYQHESLDQPELVPLELLQQLELVLVPEPLDQLEPLELHSNQPEPLLYQHEPLELLQQLELVLVSEPLDQLELHQLELVLVPEPLQLLKPPLRLLVF